MVFLSCYFFCLTSKRFGLFSYIVAVGNLSAIYRIRVTIIIRYNPNNIIVGLYLIIIFHLKDSIIMDLKKYYAELNRLLKEFKVPDHVRGNDIPAVLRHRAREYATSK